MILKEFYVKVQIPVTLLTSVIPGRYPWSIFIDFFNIGFSCKTFASYIMFGKYRIYVGG